MPNETPFARRIFANRTLNLRSIGAIGYDMDYTLVHYRVRTWEERAYARLRDLLASDGWPVEDLSFDAGSVIRGLIVDAGLGNIVKANRFGYVLRAAHGTRMLDFAEQRNIYRHTPVQLSDPRFIFVNTLFSLSETCLYSQLVDLFDEGRLTGVVGYEDLFRKVRSRMDEAHLEGTLKAEITADPARFIDLDPLAPLALLDQQRSGKRLMLISNAEWEYAREIMAFAFDPYLEPEGLTWRDLFELVIVSARKPSFFTDRLPLFSVADEEQGLLTPVPGAIPGPGIYLGGDAARVEGYLGLSGSQILYVGDHVFADVRMSKASLRWRTALILRELEEEIEAIEAIAPVERELSALMADKEALEERHRTARLELQRAKEGYGPQPQHPPAEVTAELDAAWEQMVALDERIAPLARQSARAYNPRWGTPMRSGYDFSHLARQVERSADIYTSRVSNFLHATPFAYLRAKRGSMPHDVGEKS
ncbi:MAG: HAD-IG family 5'-nucleotidase [Thermoanaerobaculales bacterium]|jgi:HAD superfamily 5'-nucleotidase-like hydrolase|nr:HAD-IG family 5'-nucleotidase [Thermoanaerobaculales bacterium]